VKVECSACEVPMARLHEVPDPGGGAPVQVFLCGGCGGRVAVQDDAPRRPRSGRSAAPDLATLHGVDVAFPAEEGEAS
jgi:hypothetical protein